jgi:hypothetical protein
MKFFRLSNLPILILPVILSCSDEDELKRKGDADLAHEGEKWNISSVQYTLIDQSTSGQIYKTGTKANARTFYFVSSESRGSFEMEIERYNKEDLFSYTIDADGNLSILHLEQSVGETTNQNVLAINAETTAIEMNLDGSIIKQSTTGQFIGSVHIDSYDESG